MDTTISKPSFDEVYKYAKKSVLFYIEKKAPYLSRELKEEIEQDAMLRVWQAYQNLDPQRGWKSFIQLHCNGSVLDYLKSGDQNTESELNMIRVEIPSGDDDGENLQVEQVLGILDPQHDEDEKNKFNPNWDLISRMAGKDEGLHIVAKVLLGYSQEMIAEQYEANYMQKNSRERISQKIHEFFKKLDSPEFIRDPWVNQCIYALGLCDLYGQPESDNGLGWNLERYDLNDDKSFIKMRRKHFPSMFDVIDDVVA
jgi:DNA-directed RNA polymerase specialized sigma24 family protein